MNLWGRAVASINQITAFDMSKKIESCTNIPRVLTKIIEAYVGLAFRCCAPGGRIVSWNEEFHNHGHSMCVRGLKKLHTGDFRCGCRYEEFQPCSCTLQLIVHLCPTSEIINDRSPTFERSSAVVFPFVNEDESVYGVNDRLLKYLVLLQNGMPPPKLQCSVHCKPKANTEVHEK
jgi:hypothetical protein